MECVCLQDAATISHKDTLKWQDGWDVFLCSFLCVFLWAMYSWNMIITSTDKHHTGTKVDNGRWRILTMGERACNNEAMVRFAEEKDETWLTQQAPMTIFTKIHKTSSLKMLFFLPHSSFNTSNHEENKELFKYYSAISTRSKSPEMILSLLVKTLWRCSRLSSLWKWQCLSCASMQLILSIRDSWSACWCGILTLQ